MADDEADWKPEAVVKVVACVWSDVLGIECPGPGDDFFQLGGDSLSALAVSKRLTELGGGSWPEDGIVAGKLSYVRLWHHYVLSDFALYILQSGICQSWPSSAVLEADEKMQNSCEPTSSETPENADKQELVLAGQPAMMHKQRELRHFAACGNLEKMGALLAGGVHPTGGEGREAPLEVGVSALHAAANTGQAAAVELLLAHGGNPNAKMFFYKRTPSHCAAAAGSLAALKALHAAGGALRAKDKSRLTLTHDAARGGSAECVQWVLEASGRADLNARDKWGRTPLHWTVLNGHADAARALLEAGAEVEPKHMPQRIQRRRTSLLQPASLASLARQFHPPDHPLHAVLSRQDAASPREERGGGGEEEEEVDGSGVLDGSKGDG